jgi:hypothetical protein
MKGIVFYDILPEIVSMVHSTLKTKELYFPKRRFTFNGLHGVAFQKIEFIKSTALSTSFYFNCV